MRPLLAAAVAALTLILAPSAVPAIPPPAGPSVTASLVGSRLVIDADGLTPDQAVGVHLHYQPDGTVIGRTGNINLDDGVVQPGTDADDAGLYETAVSRRQMITETPGELTIDVYQADAPVVSVTLQVAG